MPTALRIKLNDIAQSVELDGDGFSSIDYTDIANFRDNGNESDLLELRNIIFNAEGIGELEEYEDDPDMGKAMQDIINIIHKYKIKDGVKC